MTMPGFNSAGGERLVGLDILRASAIALVLNLSLSSHWPIPVKPILVFGWNVGSGAIFHT